MIKDFKCKETQGIWRGCKSKKFSNEIQNRAFMKLRQLNAAVLLNDLRVPNSNCLESLKGDRKGQWSIRINQQWRICFKWQNGDALDIEIVDYH